MNKKGFTLVEILAVIAIIATLSVAAVVGVNTIISKTKERTATMAENTVAESSISFFQKEKLYINPCTNNRGNFISISQNTIKKINDDLRTAMKDFSSNEEKYIYAKSYTNNINNNAKAKKDFNNKYLSLKSENCFKTVTVGELIDKGYMVDNENLCDKASVIIVYQKATTNNKTGQLSSIQEAKICHSKK